MTDSFGGTMQPAFVQGRSPYIRTGSLTIANGATGTVAIQPAVPMVVDRLIVDAFDPANIDTPEALVRVDRITARSLDVLVNVGAAPLAFHRTGGSGKREYKLSTPLYLSNQDTLTVDFSNGAAGGRVCTVEVIGRRAAAAE